MAGASDNGDRPPGGGSPDGLPEFPEEWGVIVIPDDLSELSDEVEAVRAELHTAAPLNRWQRLARRPTARRLRRLGGFLTHTPALIITLAALVTVASLFASAWPGPPRQPATQRTSGATESRSGKLPALDLIDSGGQSVSILGRLPAVVLLTEGCDCAPLIADTIAAVSTDITVLTVSKVRASAGPSATGQSLVPTAGTPRADGKVVAAVQDPTDTLRRHLGLAAPDGTAAVVLVDHGGQIVRVHPRTASVETFRPDLSRL